MERYSPEYIDDEPLDLSIKPRVVEKSPCGNAVHQESPMCLVKSCDCNSPPIGKKRVGNSSYLASPYDSRYYSKYSPNHHLPENNDVWRKNYESPPNRHYLNSHQSNCTYLNNSQSNSSHHSLHTFPKHQSTTGFLTKDEMPERCDQPSYTQTVRRQSYRGSSLMDYVNDSIENGLQSEKVECAPEPPRRIKREYNESPSESLRQSPSGSKKQKIDNNSNAEIISGTPEINEQPTKEETDVVKMDTSSSPGPEVSTPTPQENVDGEASSSKSKGNNAPSKENGLKSEGISKPSSKIPALDYLISKVLVERLDVPYIPKSHAIKRIFSGEGKGQLRLVDLIELQVEESLKV